MSSSPAPSPAAPAAPAPSPAATPPSTPTPSRPDYIPEKFWDATTNAPKVEDLAKSYQHLETRQGTLKESLEAERLAKRPEAADKYEFTIEGIDNEALTQLPLTGVLRDVAFELGLGPDEANGVAAKVIGALIKDTPDPAAEKAKLGPNADARLQALDTFIEKTFEGAEERKVFEYIARNATGVQVMEKLIALAGGGPAADTRLAEGGAGGEPTALTKQDLHKMMDDPRYWNAMKRDPAFVKQVEDGWAKLGGR